MSTVQWHGGAASVATTKAAAVPREPASSRVAAITILAYAVHLPLALLEIAHPVVAAVHALAALALGLAWAMTGRRPWRVAYVAAYIVGAEVFWRMVRAPVFWEFSKYAIALLFLVGAARLGRDKTGASPIAILYFALLLPSALMTAATADRAIAVNSISFNLSGPFALTASILFFSRVELSARQLRRLLLIAAAPVVGVSVIVWKGAAIATEIAIEWEAWGVEYFKSSNAVVSGGFSPNQVSAILGFAVLLLALYLLIGGSRAFFGAVLAALLLFFASQSAMTFSRGGLYMAGTSAAIASVYLFREKTYRRRLIRGTILVGAAALFIVIPHLVSATGGAIVERFSAADTTGRAEIAEADIGTWLRHPIAGVGPGAAQQARARFFRFEASHTEFTRLLAEHGLFGLGAIFCLIALVRKAITMPASRVSKALRAAFLLWGVLFMLIYGFRLAAPALAFGFSFAGIGVVQRSISRGPQRSGVRRLASLTTGRG